jgi:hypothetical protein
MGKYEQAKISILFVSYLRIVRIDFDATSSDLVALSLLCRMVQLIRIFNERKSRKVDNKGKRDLMSESVEIRVKFGGLSKSSKINFSIIKQPKISILFISYLRIG